MPRTSPASVCVVSVADLDRNLAFYRDVLGLDASPELLLAGDAFTGQWRLPAGSTARSALLAHPASAVGRILLVQFDRPGENVRGPSLTRQFLGLWNLNFYTTDIERASRELACHGCPSWTPPTTYAISGETGAPTEVIVDGPEGVIFNLVQPQGPPETLVGQIRAFLDVPLDGVTRIVFMKGDHLFGKVALAQPVSYTLPNFAPRMVAPAVGFLAMGFEVDDVEATVARVGGVGAPLYSAVAELELPGLGRRRTALVRTPGSGALSWLLARG